ncbi:hypothetical protein GGR54DRAFT_594151 [Hypoxylon sp. NC1633]|nr:hypothetical protein GGR54DRAFT_594151 [Hypoxylon sp. NC1633]
MSIYYSIENAMDSLKTWICRCFPKNRHVAVADQNQSLLLTQPLDILLEIADKLPPESSLALSLTCKVAFGTFFPSPSVRVPKQNLERFLLLLEKDVSDRLFYCHLCRRLHPFSHSWEPHRRCQDRRELLCSTMCYSYLPLSIGFYHVQLVMNEHFFGPGRGLSLGQLTVDHPSLTTKGWHVNSMAKIIMDQLYISIKQNLILQGTPARNCTELARILPRDICQHKATYHRGRIFGGLAASHSRPQSRRIDDIEECYEVPGYCTVCLTDFTITVKRHTTIHSVEEGWEITIVSYHQLGECRTPSDWRWQTLGMDWPEAFILRKDFLHSLHRPGSVRTRWEGNIET